MIEKHTLLSRWFHWINFPILSLMLWSGILIYWAHQAYGQLPEALVESFSLDFSLAEGMGWHFFLMWIYAINGLLYVLYLLVSGQWRTLLPDKANFKESLQVLAYELKLSKSLPVQRGKYNAAQKLAYCGALLLGLGTLLTGIAIYKPVQFGILTELLGGYKAARLEHFLLMIGFLLFFLIHVTQVIRAGWNNFRSMLAGYELEKK